ncbi:sigma-70 family RNA polymerase sigma factor [Adlercreutzia sp. R7]|uniref:Sigma-70 family RNA polymerase sigma factor n=1 Tax=Adlercreutzia wanghongyangiae TaxID=3111451 RepID=A0ABU6IKQ2_9ACTN|nr:sigma-70 family RNA polymerase sigma factor [Adlercreutzia sp. R7]
MATGDGRTGGFGYDEHAKEKLADLVVRAQADDRGAFEELYRRTAQAQYFTIVGRVGEQPAADILQEVYLVAWKNRAKIRPQAVLGYLSATARNLCLQHFQQRARMADAPVVDEGAEGGAAGELVASGAESDAADPAGTYDAAERRARLAHALRHDLTDRERDAVLMRYYLGMKVGAIAEQMEVSRNTVRNLINSALPTLRRKVGVLPMGAGLSAALSEAVERPLAPGVHPRPRPRSAGLQWGTRAVAAATVAAAVGVLGFAAAWQPTEPVMDEPVPLMEPEPKPTPADAEAPQLVSADVENGLLALTVRDDGGMEAVWCVAEDGTRYDAVTVGRAADVAATDADAAAAAAAEAASTAGAAVATDADAADVVATTTDATTAGAAGADATAAADVQPSDVVEAAQTALSVWWFEVPSGSYEVHLVDAAGNEASGTVNADVKPIYPAPTGSR